MSNRANPSVRVVIAVVAIAVIAALSVLLMRPELVFKSEPLAESQPQFSLTAAGGVKVTQTTYRGKYQLIYFGYSSCPDICPVDLVVLMTAYSSLGVLQQSIQPIFISVDYLRDNPSRMGKYAAALHSDLVGLSGSENEIRKAASSFKVAYRVIGEGENISVEHSAYIYFLDREGRLVSRLTANTDSGSLAARLRAAIQK